MANGNSQGILAPRKYPFVCIFHVYSPGVSQGEHYILFTVWYIIIYTAPTGNMGNTYIYFLITYNQLLDNYTRSLHIKVLYHQFRNSHYEDDLVLRPSYCLTLVSLLTLPKTLFVNWCGSTKIFRSHLKMCSSSKDSLSILTKSCVR